MATIEPLNSVKNAPGRGQTKPLVGPAVNTGVPADGQTVNVDETSASVTRPQPEDDKSGVEAGSRQQSANADVNAKQANTKQAQQQKSEQLKKAIAEMNRRINNSNEEAVFGVHEDTNRIMIKIMDKETKEVIKEFPPEKTLDMIARIWEMAGILVDEKL